MSGDAENEYFSDGISEEILNVLAKVPDLSVAARTSSFQFKGEKRDVAEIASLLKVRMVLEGSVRKQADRVRVTAQLIDAQTGFHLWSETYDRELKDVFAIQDEIARAIGTELKVRVLGKDEGATTRQWHQERRSPRSLPARARVVAGARGGRAVRRDRRVRARHRCRPRFRPGLGRARDDLCGAARLQQPPDGRAKRTFAASTPRSGHWRWTRRWPKPYMAMGNIASVWAQADGGGAAAPGDRTAAVLGQRPPVAGHDPGRAGRGGRGHRVPRARRRTRSALVDRGGQHGSRCC